MVFTVDMGGTSDREVTVRYATADGTATAGERMRGGDYTATSGTLTLAAGESREVLTVAVLADTTDEKDETFTVSLSDASGSGATLSTTAGTATVTIVDGNNSNRQPAISYIPDQSNVVLRQGTFFTIDVNISDPDGEPGGVLGDCGRLLHGR